MDARCARANDRGLWRRDDAHTHTHTRTETNDNLLMRGRLLTPNTSSDQSRADRSRSEATALANDLSETLVDSVNLGVSQVRACVSPCRAQHSSWRIRFAIHVVEFV